MSEDTFHERAFKQQTDKKEYFLRFNIPAAAILKYRIPENFFLENSGFNTKKIDSIDCPIGRERIHVQCPEPNR
jgi:hypothetical protein